MPSISHPLRRFLLAGAAVLVLGGAAVGIAAAQAQPTTTTGQPAQTGYQKFVDALAKRLNVSTATLETAIGQARTDAGLPAGGSVFPGGEHRGRGGVGLELNAAATAIGITPEQLRTELQGKSLAQVAQAHGKTAADVATALKNAAHQRIDAAVTAGKLTADQATQRKTQIDQRIDQQVNQVMPQGGPGGPGGFRGRGGFGLELNAAATAVGITPEQLRAELPGKSLAQVAQAHGKTAAEVATALKNAAHQRIDAAVTAGQLTADQATQRKTQVDQRVDQQINQVLPQRGPGGAGANEEAEAGL
jgi:polyhydroxyalkanoate synthesis regulator phasin